MSVAKKVTIVIVAALLLVLILLIEYIASRPREVSTVGKLIFISDLGTPGDPHLWISSADGSDAKPLTHGAERDSSPSFSPSGSQIVYISDQTGAPQVTVMDADGDNVHAVTTGTSSKAQPAFSPAGDKISYLTGGRLMVTDLDGEGTDAVLPQLPPSTGSTADVADTPQLSVVSYEWQPVKPGEADAGIGAVIANGDNTNELQGTDELEILPTVDGDVKHLALGSAISLDWTPDGSTLFGAIIDVIALHPPAGTPLRPGQDMAAVPKGQTVSGIYAFGLDGGKIAADPPLGYISHGLVGPQNPTASPDGTSVSFEAWPSTSPDTSKILGIFNQPIDASTAPTLLNAALKGPATDLRWSPDGAHWSVVVPVPNRPDESDLTVYDVQTNSLHKITNSTALVSGAAWSPQLPKD